MTGYATAAAVVVCAANLAASWWVLRAAERHLRTAERHLDDALQHRADAMASLDMADGDAR